MEQGSTFQQWEGQAPCAVHVLEMALATFGIF
jgi:hypothetical protein